MGLPNRAAAAAAKQQRQRIYGAGGAGRRDSKAEHKAPWHEDPLKLDNLLIGIGVVGAFLIYALFF